MEVNRWSRILIALLALTGGLGTGPRGLAAEYVVYSTFRAIDMGGSAEPPPKDYYVNMGKAQGVREGTILEVFRRTPTYDLLTEKLYKDVTFPIARLRVIHAENAAAIARLDKPLPAANTPSAAPVTPMMGDLVQIAE
jgi:hypothetical protein